MLNGFLWALAYFDIWSCARWRWCFSCFSASSLSIGSWATSSTKVSPGMNLAKDSGALPYTTSKGVQFAAPWKLVLHQYYAQGKNFAQALGCSEIKHLRYVSKVLLSTSIWPSDSGWYAVLILRVVPCNLKISCQKWLTKVGFLSLTMDVGTPCSLIIALTKT